MEHFEELLVKLELTELKNIKPLNKIAQRIGL